jgi:hypothetical protein
MCRFHFVGLLLDSVLFSALQRDFDYAARLPEHFQDVLSRECHAVAAVTLRVEADSDVEFLFVGIEFQFAVTVDFDSATIYLDI